MQLNTNVSSPMPIATPIATTTKPVSYNRLPNILTTTEGCKTQRPHSGYIMVTGMSQTKRIFPLCLSFSSSHLNPAVIAISSPQTHTSNTLWKHDLCIIFMCKPTRHCWYGGAINSQQHTMR